jgi:hypothetical protein
MPEKPKKQPKHSRDERLVIELDDPEEAVKALLEADPKAIPRQDEKDDTARRGSRDGDDSAA